MGMPLSFISLLRATTHPSLLDSTTTGTRRKSGRNSRSQETKKLLLIVKLQPIVLI